MFFPKSTKCGAPILIGSPLGECSENRGLAGVQGVCVQVLPKSVDQQNPTKGPIQGQL